MRVYKRNKISFEEKEIIIHRLKKFLSQEKSVLFEVMTRDLYFDFQPHLEYYYRTAVLGENVNMEDIIKV